MTLTPPDSTLTAIRLKVRRLTTSPNESSLPTAIIDQAINTFYQSDFPYAIKLDQMRSVYSFYTSPNVDRYPLNVNFNQGIRSPVYFEGIEGMLFKDRQQYFAMWPRFPTLNNVSIAPEVLTSGVITNIIPSTVVVTQTQITSAAHGLAVGALVLIEDVVGMTELNGNSYTVTAVSTNTYRINVDSSSFSAYVSGGTWSSLDTIFEFTIGPTPFLSQNVVLGSTDSNGNAIRIADDGNGNLYYQLPNAVALNPSYLNKNPGMKNSNISSLTNQSSVTIQTYPGDQQQTLVGTVNYVTGEFTINLAVGIGFVVGSLLEIWVSQYSPGRPYTLMFWNNEFTVRPVPDKVYKVEVETYLTPVQFLETGDNPILNQWWQYIAYGAACEILRERQDFDGVNSLMEGFKRQESLVLERQGTEEIGQRNSTIFCSSTPNQGWNQIGWYS